MAYLIDTDIIIYSLKNHPNVVANFKKYESTLKSISLVTYGELLFRAKKSKNIEKNLAVVYRMKELFPILALDHAVIEAFSDLRVYCQKNGNIVDDMDLLIAATAQSNNLVLVTNNEKHFKKIKGLAIENWTK